MKKACLISLIFAVSAPMAFAKGGHLSRGGLGSVFPDANSFLNPSRFATMTGFSAQGEFVLFKDVSPGFALTRPSIAFGNGKVGMGLYGQRLGNMTSPRSSTDSVGVAGGVALVKEKLLFGASYERSIDANPPSDGVLSGTFSLIPKGKGVSLVAGGSTTFNADTEIRTVGGGIGYAFSPMVMVEVAGKINDLNDLSDFTATAGMSVQGRVLYAAGLYTYNKVAATHGAEGRLGFIIGNVFDAAGYAQKTFTTGSSINFGGSGRLRF